MKPKQSAASRFALPSVIIIAAFGLSAAHAASDTWNQTAATTYSWNDGLNWATTNQFPNGSTQTANVNNDIAGNQTINLNVPVTLGTLNLGDSTGTSVFTIAAGGGSLIFDNGVSNAALATSGGSNVISSGIHLNSNLVVTNATALTLSGAITGYGGLTRSGAGTLTLSNNTQTFAGNVDIQTGGQLTVDLGARTLPSTASINIASGATFQGQQTNANTRTFAGLTGDGSFLLNSGGGAKTIIINNAANNTFTGAISLTATTGTSTNSFTKSNIGDYTLSGAAGILTMGGTTTGASTLAVTGGRFILDNSGVIGNNLTNRVVKSGSGEVLLSLTGGDLSFIGNANAASSETLGAMTLGTSRGSKISVAAGSGQAASLTLASLAVTAGSTTGNARTTTGGILFRGTALGTAAPGTANVSNILFTTTAPTLTGGGGAAGSPTISILPNALGDTSATGLGTGLVTYDATNGIRLINTTSEVSAYSSTGTPADENQKITASGTIAGQTVNSLLMASSGTTTIGTANLTLGSGALVFTGSGSQAIVNSGFGLVVADKAAYVSVTDAAGIATLDGITITGSSAGYGLVKQGAGTLILKGQVTGNAGYVVAAGTLKAGGNHTLFRNTTSLGVTLRVQNGATADMAGFAQSNAANGTVQIEQGGILTNTVANAEFILTGANSSSGGTDTSTISGLITDGTTGDTSATGLVSIKVSGADSKAITLTHGGHTLNNATVSSGNGSNNTITFNSLTSTDNNTIYGTVFVQKGGRIIANAVSDGTNYSTTLGTAAIDLGATGGSSATDSVLTVNSKGTTAALTNQTLTWTNNVTVGSGQTQGSIVVGSGDGGLSTGNTQQFGTLNVTGATRTFNSTSNNGYTTEFTGATTLTHTAATTQTFNVAAGTLALNAVGESGTGAKGLTKSGAGTLLIKGAGSYTGATTINGGTLKLGAAASLTTPPTLTVASGATFDVTAPANPFSIAALSGSGTVAGSSSVSGTVAPGGSIPGTLTTTANLTVPGTLDIDLVPIGVAQVETATAAGAVDADGGNVTVTVTGVGITGSPLAITVPVTALDPAATWAGTVRTALSGNAAITALYTVGGSDEFITLTRNVSNVANDSTLNIALANAGSPNSPTITAAPTSADTVAGIAQGLDSVVVGGALNLTSGTLDVSVVGSLTAPAYIIAKYDSLVGTFASEGTLPSGYTLNYAYNDGNNTKNIALVQTGGADPFDNWATTTHGLSGGNAEPDADPDQDGLDNAIEFVVGGLPNPATVGSMSAALAPTLTTDATNLVFTYRNSDLSATQPGISTTVEYGSNLSGWTTATHGMSGVTIVTTNDFYGSSPGVDRVVVTIPKTLAAGAAKLFARLKVIIP